MSKEPKTDLNKHLELLEKCAKAAAVIGILFYTTGMVVANQYLAQFDLSDFGSLKPKYVLTGAWTIMLMIVVGSPGVLFVYMLDTERVRNLPSKVRRLLGLFTLVVGGLVAYGALYLIQETLSEGGEKMGFIDSIFVITMAIVIFIMLFNVVFMLWLTERLYDWPLLSIFPLLVFSFFALSTIGKSIYGHFPEAVGGARPINAELILNRDGAAFWAQTGVVQNSCNGCTRTLPVKIIYQNDEVMVVQAAYTADQHEGQKLVILRKPLVEVILPVEKKRR
jgi:hypothetical protein